MRYDLLPAKYRIGMLIPSSNITIEREYYNIMPKIFSFHFDRLPMTALTDDGIRTQVSEVQGASRRLADAKMNLVMFCQTAASFWLGTAWDMRTLASIMQDSRATAMTAAGTMIGALRAMGIARVGLGAPFPEDVGQKSIEYLEGSGIEVVSSRFLGFRDNARIAEISPAAVADLVLAADSDAAEAIVIPGGNMPCMAVAETLEREIGKPIISTNQAGMWAILAHFSWTDPLPDCGVLLREIPRAQ